MRLGSLNLKPEYEEAWKPGSGLSESGGCVNTESIYKKHMFSDVQGMKTMISSARQARLNVTFFGEFCWDKIIYVPCGLCIVLLV